MKTTPRIFIYTAALTTGMVDLLDLLDAVCQNPERELLSDEIASMFESVLEGFSRSKTLKKELDELMENNPLTAETIVNEALPKLFNYLSHRQKFLRHVYGGYEETLETAKKANDAQLLQRCNTCIHRLLQLAQDDAEYASQITQKLNKYLG